jgi:hypothetical protein
VLGPTHSAIILIKYFSKCTLCRVPACGTRQTRQPLLCATCRLCVMAWHTTKRVTRHVWRASLPCVTAITHDKECFCRVLYTAKLPNSAFFCFLHSIHTNNTYITYITIISHKITYITIISHTSHTYITYVTHKSHVQVHNHVTSSTTEQNNPSANTREAQMQIQPFAKCPTPSPAVVFGQEPHHSKPPIDSAQKRRLYV